MGKGLKHRSDEERLREMQKRRLRKNLLAV